MSNNISTAWRSIVGKGKLLLVNCCTRFTTVEKIGAIHSADILRVTRISASKALITAVKTSELIDDAHTLNLERKAWKTQGINSAIGLGY